MTYEEAHEKISIAMDEDVVPAAVQNPHFWDVIMTALKKQIPTEARIDTDYNIDTPVMIMVCPTCGQEFGFNEPKFCENCGQAIDWEEEE